MKIACQIGPLAKYRLVNINNNLLFAYILPFLDQSIEINQVERLTQHYSLPRLLNMQDIQSAQ